MDRILYAALFTMNRKLNKILELLGEEVMPELDQLAEQIGRLESVADQIVAKLQQSGVNVDPAQVQALVDRLKAVGDKLEGAAAG